MPCLQSPFWSEMNTVRGHKIISVLEKQISSDHTKDSVMLRNNDD